MHWLINRIGLINNIPFELVNIIKQWKMYSIKEIKQIEYKNYIYNDTLNHVIVDYENIDDNKYWYQIQPLFCSNCGNYYDKDIGGNHYNKSCKCNY